MWIFFIFIILGFLPSLIWLSFYLKKDVHPEPKWMVLKIFLMGMILAGVVAFVEWEAFLFLEKFSLPYLLKVFFYFFVCVAFIEEFSKYLVFRIFVQNNIEFDEPIDAMIYMIIIGLGFVAIENILVLISEQFPNLVLQETFMLLFLRFISATLVHALASANIGFFAALSFLKKRCFILWGGIVISSLLHGIYNLLIKFGGMWGLFVSFSIVVFLFVIILIELKMIKKLKSICKI